MALLRIIVMLVGFLQLSTRNTTGFPTPLPTNLRERLSNLRDALEFLETTVDVTYNDAKDDHCDNNVCEVNFLEGVGNPLCHPRLTSTSFNATMSRMVANIERSQLSLKMWGCVLTPVLKELGLEYLGDENDTNMDSIAYGVRQVEHTIRSLPIPQNDDVSATPCGLVLLRTFKRHLTSVRHTVITMRADMQAQAQ